MPTSVLIVDDHARFRRSARRLLELEGYEVVGEASDGASAVQACAELRPDAVLLDVNLPDATGFDVAERLRPFGARVILTSAREPSQLVPLARGAGACGFVPKGELTGAALARLLA